MRKAGLLALLLTTVTVTLSIGVTSVACAAEQGQSGALFTIQSRDDRTVVLEREGSRVTLASGEDYVYVRGVPRYAVVARKDETVVLRRLPAPAADPVRAINHASAGATVVVGKGTYRGRITVPRGVTVVGSGRRVSWLKGSLRFSSDCLISGLRIGDRGACAVRNRGNVSHTRFVSCQFRGGGGAAHSGNDNVVTLTGASRDVVFERCRVERNLGVESAGHTRHFDNVFINPSTNAPSMDTIVFRRCHFGVSNGKRRGGPRFNVEIWTDPGLRVRTGGFTNISFEGCTFEAAADANIDFSGATLSADNLTPANGPCLIRNCVFKGNGKGRFRWVNDITAEEGAGYLTITGNTFYRGQGHAFYAENQRSNAPASCYGYNTFSDNVVDATSRVCDTGIPHKVAWDYVRLDSQYNVVSGNKIINTSRYRQCVSVHGAHNQVIDNVFINKPASYYTIGLGARSRNNVVVRNVLTGGGIDNDGSGNTIAPNP